jgi:methanogenic corrinoid protein MtbC1
MAAIALRYDGWRVHHLASDVPVGDLTAFLEREGPDLVVLSTTMTGTRAGTVAQQAAEAHGIPVLVGARGRRLDELLASARDI